MKKKICVPYLLLYILAPAVTFIFFIFFITSKYSTDDTAFFLLTMLYSLLFVLWFLFVPIITPIVFRKSAYKKLAKSGFQIERTYRALTYSMMIDIKGGKIAMLSSFDPFTATIVPANRLEKIWINTGFSTQTAKTNRVSVFFRIDNDVTNFDTYRQPKGIWLSKDHPTIIAAIKKADTIAHELNEAWKNGSKTL